MSDDIAIRVVGLGKKYTLGEQREKYKTIQDAIVNSVKMPFRRIFNKNSGLPVNKFWALKDVSFDVHKGEVIGIIGRNGAGKSTLLKILSRITTPTEGEVQIKGRVGSLLEVGTGFHPEMTGRENIFLNGSILGMKKVEIEQKFDAIVKFAEIDNFIDTPVKRYSSGMYVRLAFAVAAHLDPEILIVDEVLAVGDIGFQKKCLGKMGDISKEGRTVLFVSHNMGAVHNLCSRCIMLNQGRLVSEGDTNHVINEYISDGAVNRAEYYQPHSPDKPINLRSVRLFSKEGKNTSEFRFDEGFIIAIEYEVNVSVSGCCVWTGLRTIEGNVIIDTADTDVDGHLLGTREVGYYNTLIKVPPSWLNTGNYILVVGIVRYNPETTYDRVEAANISILDIGTPEKIRTGFSRPGILQPFIKWETPSIGEGKIEELEAVYNL